MLEPTPQTRIVQRYRLERLIARGGMGSVWAAVDEKLKRDVAIKLLSPSWTASDDARGRFEREAMAVAKLQTPHVVQIFDYGVESDTPFIVMEKLKGEDLRTRLHREKTLSLEDTAILLVQVAKALSIAHGAGIVHRDLKPGNVFIVHGEEELVKVLDFGVAKLFVDDDYAQERTKEGALLGTPQFMSPEQARGHVEIDLRADIWSLGVIVFKALTGRLPFLGKAAGDVIVRICTETAPAPTSINPDLPAEADAFFEKALAQKRDNRFASAKEMALAFGALTPIHYPTLSLLPGDGGPASWPSARLSWPGARPSRPGEPPSSRPYRASAPSFSGDEAPTSGPLSADEEATQASFDGDFETIDRSGEISAPGSIPRGTDGDDDEGETSMRSIDATPIRLALPPLAHGSKDVSVNIPPPPSMPTLGGHTDPSGAPPRLRTNATKTLILAACAIACGVIVAIVGSRMVRDQPPRSQLQPAAQPSLADVPTGAPLRSAASVAVAPPTSPQAPSATAPDKPPSATRVNVVLPAEPPAAPQPTAPVPTAKAAPPPPSEPDDPFAERL